MAGFLNSGLVAEFSDRVIATDLPALQVARRAEVVAFTERRIDGLPTPMKLGVGAVALFVGGLGRVVGPNRLVAFIAGRPLPVLGDYVRLIRSLAYAYVWENWPSTAPDGGAVD